MIEFDGTEIRPGKVVCVGRNYVEHIHELGNEFPPEMVLFCKPASSVSRELVVPRESRRFEGELCLLMGPGGTVKGVGLGLDLTLDKVQNRLKEKGLPWERAKAFKNSALFSRFIPLEHDLATMAFRLEKNGETVQEAPVTLMIYPPEEILAQAEGVFGLEEDDLVMTGTPKGVGGFEEGDLFEGVLCAEGEELLRCSWRATASPGV